MYYIVQPGDTLYGIAVRFGVPIASIIQANNLTNPNAIYAGLRLYIPISQPTPPFPPPPPPFPGPTPPPFPPPGGDLQRQINQLNRQVDRLNNEVDRLRRRVERLEQQS